MTRIFLSAAAMILMSASAAFAHHPLGGMTPQTALHGLLSGIGHPVIGFDHLAFVVGVGLIAAFHRSKLAMPAAFVGGTMAGTMLTVSAFTLPLAEIVITASVVVAGMVAMRGKVTDLRFAAALGAARIWNIIDGEALQPRLAGFVVAGVGLAFILETVEGMIFPAM